MIIVIDNLDFDYHFEIIESIIQKYDTILKIKKKKEYQLYLENITSIEYIEYINKIYPLIEINQKIDNYDYKIFTTFYFKDLNNYIEQINNPTKYFFICHEVDNNLKKYNNVFYLTPLCNNNNFYDILTEDDLYNDMIEIKSRINKPIIYQGHVNFYFDNYEPLKNKNYVINERQKIDNTILKYDEKNSIIYKNVFKNYNWRNLLLSENDLNHLKI